MKKIFLFVGVLLMSISMSSQNKNAKTTLEVDGVCGMCKVRIEKAALNTKGVKSANWDVKSHELKLIYDGRKTDLKKIQNSIVAVGHDTKELKATEEAYASVHPCCRYRSDDVKKDHKEEVSEEKNNH